MGYPTSRSGWGTPQPGQNGVHPVQIRMGYPCLGQDGVPPSQVRIGYPPGQVRMGHPQPDQDGVPCGQVRMGYLKPGQDGIPPPAGSGWGTLPHPSQVRIGYPPPPSQVRTGYLPQARLRYDMLCRGWYASCGFPREDFLVNVRIFINLDILGVIKYSTSIFTDKID